MSGLVGVMLVDSRFYVYEGAQGVALQSALILHAADDGKHVEWRFGVTNESGISAAAHGQYLPALSVPIGQPPSPVTIDTAIAQAYDAFCLQYDLWRRASHIEWLPVLPMSLGVEPGQRSGTWTFAAAPAPKAPSPEGQQPTKGRKQKQHGKSRSDRAASKAGAGKRSKRG